MKYILHFTILCFILTSNSFAKSDIKFLETQLLFDGKKRSGKLTIFNQGDQPATAKIVFKKHIVYPDGRKTFEDMNFEYNQYPYNVDITKSLKISPRRITLDPKRKQTFRVFLRKPPDLAAGEYRVYAFLEVVELVTEEKANIANSDEVALDIDIGVSLGIPIVVYHGELNGKIEDIASADVTPLPKDRIREGETHQIKVAINRSGNASVGGYVSLAYNTNSGKEKRLFNQSVSIIPDNEIYTFIYDFDPGINLTQLPAGSLKVQLYDKTKENLLFEKVIN